MNIIKTGLTSTLLFQSTAQPLPIKKQHECPAIPSIHTPSWNAPFLHTDPVVKLQFTGGHCTAFKLDSTPDIPGDWTYWMTAGHCCKEDVVITSDKSAFAWPMEIVSSRFFVSDWCIGITPATYGPGLAFDATHPILNNGATLTHLLKNQQHKTYTIGQYGLNTTAQRYVIANTPGLPGNSGSPLLFQDQVIGIQSFWCKEHVRFSTTPNVWDFTAPAITHWDTMTNDTIHFDNGDYEQYVQWITTPEHHQVAHQIIIHNEKKQTLLGNFVQLSNGMKAAQNRTLIYYTGPISRESQINWKQDKLNGKLVEYVGETQIFHRNGDTDTCTHHTYQNEIQVAKTRRSTYLSGLTVLHHHWKQDADETQYTEELTIHDPASKTTTMENHTIYPNQTETATTRREMYDSGWQETYTKWIDIPDVATSADQLIRTDPQETATLFETWRKHSNGTESAAKRTEKYTSGWIRNYLRWSETANIHKAEQKTDIDPQTKTITTHFNWTIFQDHHQTADLKTITYANGNTLTYKAYSGDPNGSEKAATHTWKDLQTNTETTFTHWSKNAQEDSSADLRKEKHANIKLTKTYKNWKLISGHQFATSLTERRSDGSVVTFKNWSMLSDGTQNWDR